MRHLPILRFIGCALFTLAAVTLSLALRSQQLTYSAAPTQAEGWQSYESEDAAYQFDYPPDTLITTSDDASQRFKIVYAQFVLTDTSDYQGVSVMVLENTENAAVREFLAQRYTQAGVRPPAAQPSMQIMVDARPAVRLERDAVVGDLDKYTVLIPGNGVVYRINLYGGGIGGAVEPSETSAAAFERLVASFRVLPKPLRPVKTILTPSGVNVQPRVATVFTYPLRSEAGVQYGVPEGNIIDGTRMEWLSYGIRNLDQWGIKCYGVDWTRMLHAGEDWYRLDGENSAGSPVVAVADGVVVRHSPGISYPGNVVLIRHRLPNGRDIYSMYGHVKNVRVVVGQLVQRGQQIASVTSVRYTGRTPSLHPTYDSHLHFEMRYFLDGTNIYTRGTNAYGFNYPACRYAYPGRGYTYLVSPDRYPYPNQGHVNASEFIRARLDTPAKPAPTEPPTNLPKGCIDLLKNGGFEGDAAGRPWASVANTPRRVYHTSFVSAVRARTGAHSGQLGSATLNSHWSEIIQTVRLPARVRSATLTYWRYLATTEPSRTRAYDTFSVGIETEQGLTIPRASLRFDNTSAGRGAWVRVSLALPNAAAYAGENLWVTFKGATNASNPTAVYLDDVQFVVCVR